MATDQNQPTQGERDGQPGTAKATLSLDWWSVIVALVLVLLVWIGVVQSIPW